MIASYLACHIRPTISTLSSLHFPDSGVRVVPYIPTTLWTTFLHLPLYPGPPFSSPRPSNKMEFKKVVCGCFRVLSSMASCDSSSKTKVKVRRWRPSVSVCRARHPPPTYWRLSSRSSDLTCACCQCHDTHSTKYT